MVLEAIKNFRNLKKEYLNITVLCFIIFIIVTFYVWIIAKNNVKENAENQFNGIAEKANLAIISQMIAYTHVMVSSKSLFYTSHNKVTRQQWAQFIENLELGKIYPGIQGISLNKYVTNKDKLNLIAEIKSEGFKDYNIKPEGVREEYFPVIYIEPFVNRNLRAFGFDVFSEPIRKEAILKAWETGQPYTSGKIKLVQETSKDVQNGFLVFMPLYKKETVPNNITERKNEIYGLISAVFRMNDLMQGIFKDKFENFHLRIYDGNKKNQDNLMFSNIDEKIQINSVFKKDYIEEINNHTWTVEFASTEYFEEMSSNNTPLILLISGVIFSVLLTIIILFLIALYDQTNALFQSNSDLKNTQMQLIQSAKFAALGEMAGGVAHEINNPLTVISGKAYKLIKMAKKNELDLEIIKENATAIENIVKHISKITLGLLTYSRGTEDEHLGYEEIDNIIEQATILCAEKFRNNGVELIINRNYQNSSLYCSSVQISQVLLNLLNNAFDAVKELKDKWVKIEITEDKKNYIFKISNSGPIIPEHIREKIMQPFFTTKKIGEGTGLGLSVSRGIVEKHNGLFYLDSNVKETTFVVTLPRVEIKSDAA